MEKNAWHVAEIVQERMYNLIGLLAEKDVNNFFFNRNNLKDYSLQHQLHVVTGYVYINKGETFFHIHYKSGEYFIEFWFKSCAQTLGNNVNIAPPESKSHHFQFAKFLNLLQTKTIHFTIRASLKPQVRGSSKVRKTLTVSHGTSQLTLH